MRSCSSSPRPRRARAFRSSWIRPEDPHARIGLSARGVLLLAMIQVCAVARAAETGSSAPAPVPPVADPCPRSFAAGGVVQNPPALFSSNGVLNVRFSYQHRIDANDPQHEMLCFMTP